MQRFEGDCQLLADYDVESLLHSKYQLEPCHLKNSVISCALNDEKYRRFTKNVKKIEKFFPEHVIGCKTICEESKLVTVTSRNILTVYNVPDFSVQSTSQCDYYATSMCSLILGESLEDLNIIFGSVEGDLIEWDPKNNNTLPTRRKGHCGMVFSIASDSERIFSISDDRTIRMWHKNGGDAICTVFGHTARPFAIHVDETNRKIFTGGIEQALFIWEYSNESIQLIRKIYLTSGVIRKITPIDSSTLIVGSHDGNVLQVDVSVREPLEEIAENLVNFSFLDDILVTINELNILTVYSNSDMEEILACCENVKNMSASGAEVVAWSGKNVYIVERNKVIAIEMSKIVISATIRGTHVIVKTLDGWTSLLNTENQSEMLQTRFKLPKISMIPASFVIVQNVLILATTHGQLFHCRLQTNEKRVDIQRSLDRRLEKELFGDKEITWISQISANYFTTLSKTGNWSTFEIDSSKNCVKLANTRSFPASARMGWPCQCVETIDGELFIVGFYGTSFVVWDASKGCPVYEMYCGGGHRVWQVTPCADSSSAALNFDFLRNGSLLRQRIPLDSVRHLVHSAHSSPIVCCAAAANLVASVSLDGTLSITADHSADTADYVTEFTMFAGENLLCTDIWVDESEVFVVTGGGKSKMSIWRFEKDSLRKSKTFWLRHIARPDEGRIVSTKIALIDQQILFIASFSSGSIEIFKIENEEIVSVSCVEIDDELGIGSKMCLSMKKPSILHVGTSASYILKYHFDLEEIRLISKQKLIDRSGVTAIECFGDDGGVVFGCDSGGVYLVNGGEQEGEEEVHRHLSTVVGISTTPRNIHSVSLDCAVLSTNISDKTTCRKDTAIGMPGTMAITGNTIIVAGDGIDSIKM